MSLPAVIPEFAPVPRQAKRGWTADAQRRFIAALAASGSVRIAADHVQMTRQSAYLLRAAAGSGEFRAAWDAAIDEGIKALKAVAFDRAINGEEEPVFHGGEQVGSRRRYNNQLIMRLLTHYDRPGANREPQAFGVDASCDNILARIRTRLTDTLRCNEDDYQRNYEWARVMGYYKMLRKLAWVRLIRIWMTHGADQLAVIVSNIDRIEQEARDDPMFTGEMIDAVLSGAKIEMPWLDTTDKAQLLRDAEVVEATAFMVRHSRR